MALAGAHFILRRAVAINLYAAADFSASVEREFLVGRIHASVLLVANKLWILYKSCTRFCISCVGNLAFSCVYESSVKMLRFNCATVTFGSNDHATCVKQVNPRASPVITASFLSRAALLITNPFSPYPSPNNSPQYTHIYIACYRRTARFTRAHLT